MNTNAHSPKEIERLLPLLRSIAHEIRDRTAAISYLESRVQSLKPSSRIHAEDLRLAEASLAIERREIRHAQEELERLGCRLDENDSERIVFEDEGQSVTFAWKLGDTSFHRLAPVDTAA